MLLHSELVCRIFESWNCCQQFQLHLIPTLLVTPLSVSHVRPKTFMLPHGNWTRVQERSALSFIHCTGCQIKPGVCLHAANLTWVVTFSFDRGPQASRLDYITQVPSMVLLQNACTTTASSVWICKLGVSRDLGTAASKQAGDVMPVTANISRVKYALKHLKINL